jgi:heme/copper-type cytochrome/quinol oxidase subunit 2
MLVQVAGPIFSAAAFFLVGVTAGNKASSTHHWEFRFLGSSASQAGPIAIVIVLAFFVWRDAHQLDEYAGVRPGAAGRGDRL